MAKVKVELVNQDARRASSAYIPHERVSVDAGGESRTRQEFADECDINQIMARYQKTGVVSHMNTAQAGYVDFTGVPTDFQTSMNMMLEAEQAFMRLPAVARREFENDPVKFVEFASNPDNVERMREWGLAKPAEPPPAPMKVEVINGSEEPPKAP